jgi:hypothetical protein
MPPQTFPLQPLSHGPRLPWLCAASVIHQQLLDAATNTSRNSRDLSSLRPVKPTNIIDGASTASKSYDDLMQRLVEHTSATVSVLKHSLLYLLALGLISCTTRLSESGLVLACLSSFTSNTSSSTCSTENKATERRNHRR